MPAATQLTTVPPAAFCPPICQLLAQLDLEVHASGKFCWLHIFSLTPESVSYLLLRAVTALTGGDKFDTYMYM